MRRRALQLGFLILLPSKAWSAPAGNYLKNYRAGFEIGYSSTSATLLYKHPKILPLPDECTESEADPTVMECSISVASPPTGFSVFVQQVFHRTGWFYFNSDLSFSSYILDGKINLKEPDESSEATLIIPPITNLNLHLYGATGRGYVEFGITPPKNLPDIIFSLGIAKQYAIGSIKVEDVRKKIDVESTQFCFGLEAVWWRFGDGSFSSAANTEAAVTDKVIYDASIGDASHFVLQTSKLSVAVIKIVFPWHF